jgi:hypothetical protein
MLRPVARLLAVVFDASRLSAPRIWLTAGVALTLAAAPAPAHAQLLKRIKQAAAEKAAEAAGRKVLGEDSTKAAPAATPAAGASGTASRASSSASTTRQSGPTKLDITAERLDQFLVAMEPATAAAKERAAHAAAVKRREAYDKCQADAGMKQTQAMMRGEAVGPSKAAQAEVDRLNERLNALMPQLLAAQQANDTVRLRKISEESQATSERVLFLLNPMIAKLCGAQAPSRPGPLDETRLREMAQPRRIEGMSPAQFGLMRERIALYFIAPEKVSTLTGEERAALDAKRAQFAPFIAAWKEGGMEWATWSDVWSAWQKKS